VLGRYAMFRTIEDQIKYWENMSTTSVGPLSDLDIGHRISEFVDRPKGRVLDFGCGVGRLYRGLQPFDYYVGVDISTRYLQLFRASRPHVPLICIKDFIVPFIPNDFDTIICYSVFTHLHKEHIEKLLPQFHRVLRPKGIALISIFESGVVGVSQIHNWITHERKWFLKTCERYGFTKLNEINIPEVHTHQTLFMLENR